MATTFTHTLATVVFPDSVPSITVRKEKKQLREYNSDGEPYIYTKSPNKTIYHNIQLEGLTIAQLMEYEFFFDKITDSDRDLFTWIDGAGVNRTVRFSGNQATATQVNHLYNLPIALEETL